MVLFHGYVSLPEGIYIIMKGHPELDMIPSQTITTLELGRCSWVHFFLPPFFFLAFFFSSLYLSMGPFSPFLGPFFGRPLHRRCPCWLPTLSDQSWNPDESLRFLLPRRGSKYMLLETNGFCWSPRRRKAAAMGCPDPGWCAADKAGNQMQAGCFYLSTNFVG